MMKLQVYGPAFGLPDPSPFCMKALILMKMADLDFKTGGCDPRKAPKGKAPVLLDGGTAIPDTEFIRTHLETAHGIDFDTGLSEQQKAIGHAFERLCEDQLYWIIMHERWMVDANFEKGPKIFFQEVPALMRGAVTSMVRRQIKRDLRGHGMGRHSKAEQLELLKPGVDALAAQLGDKPYLFGDEPTGSDASVGSTVSGLLCDFFPGPILDYTSKHANLIAYRDRIFDRFFPDLAQRA